MSDFVVSLDDLIREGVRIHNERLAEQARREQEEHEKYARALAEAEQAVLGLLPEALRPLAEVEVDAPFLYAKVRIPIRGGLVKCHAEPRGNMWVFTSDDDYYRRLFQATFDAWNSADYYQRCFTLEEALAFAAGAFDI